MKNFNYLKEYEAKSIYIIREAYRNFKDEIAMLVSWGKDSVTMLYLTRKAFFENIPIPVLHLDPQTEFREVYEFRDNLVKKWNINLIVQRYGYEKKEDAKKVCHCTIFKTDALKKAIKSYGFKALMVAIRRDEHAIRAKERYFSPRDKEFKWNYLNQPPELWEQFNVALTENEDHFRVHPMLHWREIDIWRYINQENIPIVPLYFADFKKKGYRYRSLGCSKCTVPIESNAKNINEIIKELEITNTAERSGRLKGKEAEYVMLKLRALGYM